MAEWIGPIGTESAGAMLMGRRSYEGMLSSWNKKGGPFKDALTAATKYVASSNPSTQLECLTRSLCTVTFPPPSRS
jgi:dihydrofolate reductase